MVLLFFEFLLNSYGFGWFISVYCGKKVIYYGGNIDGFLVFVLFILIENIGFVILMNVGGILFFIYFVN